ncbi:MAG: NmrA family NAD(P)-binding protein [Candidatus Obscuribacterales bacterium]|nr:NmrA family NAD(P)-binding protein [Candidatus Obscuribacterales bacterium]
MSDKFVLTLGVTGQIGRLLADKLVGEEDIALKVTSRRHSDLPALKEKYGDAVYLDLDDPRTFPAALQGVHSLYILTGYSVDMLVQTKALVDASKKAGVKHIVHLGVFSEDEDCYDTHFAWHQLVEFYIKYSGINYTFLHPNCFLQNLTGFYSNLKSGKLTLLSDKPMGWIALEDVAEASAIILKEGEKHYGKDYWFSTEVADVHKVAKIVSETIGKPIAVFVPPLEKFFDNLKDATGLETLDAYFKGVKEFGDQINDGRMAYIGTVRDDMPTLAGRPGISIRDWCELHRDELAKSSE